MFRISPTPRPDTSPTYQPCNHNALTHLNSTPSHATSKSVPQRTALARTDRNDNTSPPPQSRRSQLPAPSLCSTPERTQSLLSHADKEINPYDHPQFPFPSPALTHRLPSTTTPCCAATSHVASLSRPLSLPPFASTPHSQPRHHHHQPHFSTSSSSSSSGRDQNLPDSFLPSLPRRRVAVVCLEALR